MNQIAALFFLMPPVTAVIDYLVLGERLTPLKVAGIATAAFGVYLATRPRASAGQYSRCPISALPPAARRSCPAPCE